MWCRWDRNLISDEDQCTDPQCVLLQNAQRAFARALQLERMSSSAALGAYEEAIGAVLDTLGVTHPDTERMLTDARRYLDGFTVAQEMSAPELRLGCEMRLVKDCSAWSRTTDHNSEHNINQSSHLVFGSMVYSHLRSITP